MKKKHIEDGLDIPKGLQRKMTPEIRERLDQLSAEARTPVIVTGGDSNTKRRDFLQPKGMSDDEWAKWNAAKKEAAMTENGTTTPKREKKTKEKRATREGLVSIGDIVKDLGMIPREARGILRALKMQKPSCGWAWPAGEVDAIKKQIVEGKGATRKRPVKEGEAKAPRKGKAAKIPGPEETTFSAGKNGRRKWKKDDAKKIEAEAVKEAAAEVEAKAKADVAKKVAKVLAKTNVKPTTKAKPAADKKPAAKSKAKA